MSHGQLFVQSSLLAFSFTCTQPVSLTALHANNPCIFQLNTQTTGVFFSFTYSATYSAVYVKLACKTKEGKDRLQAEPRKLRTRM